MANFARPIATITRGNWVDQSGGTANIHLAIDEEVANDADFIVSPIGANTAYEVRLSSVAPAVIPRDHTIFLRGRKDSANGNVKGVDVSLIQGTTILGTQSFPALPAAVQQESIVMPRAMAAGITDYSDLRVRFTPTGITTGGSARRRVVITGVALRVPSAVDLVTDLLTRWGITVDQSNGVWQVSRSGFVGTGDTLAFAIHDLYRAMREADWQSAEIERRWRIAYYLYKSVDYQRYRAEVVAGTAPIPPHHTEASYLARIDQKLQNFIVAARGADDQETS